MSDLHRHATHGGHMIPKDLAERFGERGPRPQVHIGNAVEATMTRARDVLELSRHLVPRLIGNVKVPDVQPLQGDANNELSIGEKLLMIDALLAQTQHALKALQEAIS